MASAAFRGSAAQVIISLVFVVGVWGGDAQAANFAELGDARIVQLEAQLPAQAKGYGPPCSDRTAWGAPEVIARLKAVIDAADKLTTKDFPAWDDAAYLDYSLRGTRPNGERMMNARKAWLYPLVLAECVTGTGRYLPAIEHTLNELDDQPVWNWPAHDRDLRNFRKHDYEVDLLTADTAHDIAQALYMLGSQLTPALRRKTLATLEQRVFGPVRRSLVSGNRDHWWLHAEHNWNAVCLKGVVVAALSVLEKKADRAVFAAAAEHYIVNYVAGFTPDGYTTEGPGYWNYGFSHFTELREALYVATQGKLDLFADPKVRAMALYGYRYEMLPGNVAAFGDASPRTRLDDFTRAYANQAFGFGQPQQLASLPISGAQSGNAAPLANSVLRLFAQPAAPGGLAQAASQIGLQSYFESVGVLVSRPAPGGRFAVSIKAGGNGHHSHNDVGSYSIALDNEQPTGDPGATAYSSKTFSKERYTLRGINSWGHPVPVVDGQLQLEATKVKPRVVESGFSDNEDHLVIDMAPAYELGDAGRLTRSMRHERAGAGTVVIEDRFDFAAPKRFEVALICTGNWRQTGEGELEFWQKQQHLIGYIESSAPFEIVSESINEEGLSFTRIAVKLISPQRNGFVRVRYVPQ